ncbi:unnamed protein product [Enterobius vermicularis]|uniref:Uncharacterized protein n=1 Tax=Enterobius vermicularis TaxID=51028 RepID=A0A158QAI6_ENTVE|nr:unnamed protein product [Enterobius vermicularis]
MIPVIHLVTFHGFCPFQFQDIVLLYKLSYRRNIVTLFMRSC